MRAVAREPLGRYRVRHEHARGEPAVDVVLKRGPLVVEHRRVRYPQEPAGRRQVGRPVRQRAVETAAAREPHEAPARARLRHAPSRACRSRRGGRSPCAGWPQSSSSSSVCDSGRAVSVTSCPRLFHQLDQRPQDEHVRGVREIDPDPHQRGMLVAQHSPARIGRAKCSGDVTSRADGSRSSRWCFAWLGSSPVRPRRSRTVIPASHVPAVAGRLRSFRGPSLCSTAGRRLTALTEATRKAGYPIKVAVIPTGKDLGTLYSVVRPPRAIRAPAGGGVAGRALRAPGRERRATAC